MSSSTTNAAILRLYYTQPVTGPCGCCGQVRRMGVVDLDRQHPLCRECVPASVQAAEALRAAGMIPPDTALVELKP